MKRIQELKTQLNNALVNHVIPFWLKRSVDTEYGGFITSFDENGEIGRASCRERV